MDDRPTLKRPSSKDAHPFRNHKSHNPPFLIKQLHTDTTVDAYPTNPSCVCHLIVVVVLAPLIQTMVSICGKMGFILDMGSFPPASQQKWLGEGAKSVFGPRAPNSSCTGAKKGLHRCKTGFGWCKRLLGDLCSLAPKHLLHPLLTTFGKLPFSGSLPESWGRKYTSKITRD